MADDHTIQIKQIREDKVTIVIKSKHSYDREFDVIIGPQYGLVINASGNIKVLPYATNKIIVDCD